MRLLGLAAVALAAALAGCAPSSGPAGSVPADLISPVEGVVVDVDAAGLTEVGAFALRLADGTQVPFVVGEIENGVEFPPSHLGVHLADAQPIRVFFRRADDALVAYRLEDAAVPAS